MVALDTPHTPPASVASPRAPPAASQGSSVAAEGNSKWWSSPAGADPALLPAPEPPRYRIKQADEFGALIAREASHPSHSLQPP